MKTPHLFLLALSVIAALPLHSANPSQSASQQGMMMPMPLVAPLFVETGTISNKVTVVNAAAASSSAQQVLFDQAGTQIATQSLSLAGHSQQVIEIYGGDRCYGHMYINCH